MSQTHHVPITNQHVDVQRNRGTVTSHLLWRIKTMAWKKTDYTGGKLMWYYWVEYLSRCHSDEDSHYMKSKAY